MDIINIVVAQAVYIVALASVVEELVPVIPVQPIMRSKPHKPVPVLVDAIDGILRQAIVNGKMPECSRAFLGRKIPGNGKKK